MLSAVALTKWALVKYKWFYKIVKWGLHIHSAKFLADLTLKTLESPHKITNWLRPGNP